MASRSNDAAVSGSADGGTSTIWAETATGWHVVKIEGYTQTKSILGVGNSVKSGVFTVGGHGWCIRYYPDGYDEANTDCICFDLLLVQPDPTHNVKAKYEFSLLDNAGDPVPSYTGTSHVCTFSSTVPSWGFDRFIDRTELESSPHLKDDSFSVRCDVTVVKEIGAKTATTPLHMVPPPTNKHGHLGAVLSREHGADVTFEVGGKLFNVHRFVLVSRSSVFRAELFGSTKAKKNMVVHIRIDNMEARVFEALIHFIYTDALPEIGEGDKIVMAQDLLVAADRYKLQRLKIICENTLYGHIDASMAVATLEIAEQRGCRGLKEACFKFLKTPSNLRAVMATDGFEQLMSNRPHVVKELFSSLAG